VRASPRRSIPPAGPPDSAARFLRRPAELGDLGDDQIAVIARQAVKAVNRPGALGMDSAANDSSWLDQHGVQTVLLGPGAPELAHVSDEHVSLDQLADAVRIYARIGAQTHPEAAPSP